LASSVTDEGYSRNVQCALNLISTFFFVKNNPRNIPTRAMRFNIRKKLK
jgi:hypothetical protein